MPCRAVDALTSKTIFAQGESVVSTLNTNQSKAGGQLLPKRNRKKIRLWCKYRQHLCLNYSLFLLHTSCNDIGHCNGVHMYLVSRSGLRYFSKNGFLIEKVAVYFTVLLCQSYTLVPNITKAFRFVPGKPGWQIWVFWSLSSKVRYALLFRTQFLGIQHTLSI
jgi:hypothetical protein